MLTNQQRIASCLLAQLPRSQRSLGLGQLLKNTQLVHAEQGGRHRVLDPVSDAGLRPADRTAPTENRFSMALSPGSCRVLINDWALIMASRCELGLARSRPFSSERMVFASVVDMMAVQSIHGEYRSV